jgi:hypothetical protein
VFSLYNSLVKLDTIQLGIIDAVIIFCSTVLLQQLGNASRHCVIEGLRDSDSGDGFGGLVVSMLASGSRVQTRPKPLDF